MGIKLSIMVGVLACVAIGCGDDDDDNAAESCPADASAGTKISCHCGDSGVGIATCKNDGTIGACMCAGDGGSGGTGSSGSGGKSGSGAGNGGSGGNGGASGSNAEDDASVSEEDGGQTQPPPAPTDIPTNGDQFTACARDRDCNRNLGCYSPEGGGFCSLVCNRDEDCAGLKPGTFHCSTTGVCSLACANADDDASCPSGMQCEPIAAGGGGGGEFRCLYPVQAAEPTGTAFAACMGGGSCVDGLECAGDSMGNAGFCTHGCTPADPDCSDVVAPSGTIAASCVPQTQNMGTCALNCEAMPGGCPEGMQCVQQGFYQLCLPMN